jgi:hypothetical protein
MAIHTAIALKLHAFGLTQLHDPNWTGLDMYYHIKEHMKHRVQPYDLLQKTLRHGLLYYIGKWLFEDFFFSDTYRMGLGGEYRLWYLEDLLKMLALGGTDCNNDLFKQVTSFVEETNALYVEDKSAYWQKVDSEELYTLIDQLIIAHGTLLRQVMPDYAENYADRVFHDRQLCEHVSKTLVSIGFDGTAVFGDDPQQWVERQSSWPSWAVKAVVARDRGKCAGCTVDIALELNADGHIDHIVSLAKGGTNDLVNLQLLCDECNLAKSSSLIDVRSSVPEYLKAKRRRAKDV